MKSGVRKLLRLNRMGAVVLLLSLIATAPAPETSSFIVQGSDLAEVIAAVDSVGGDVTHELGIIDAVGARLSASQENLLARSPQVTRIYPDHEAEVANFGSGIHPDTPHPVLAGADALHQEGITGWGVTVAVIDSGVSAKVADRTRVLAHYDAISDEQHPFANSDDNGHGSHVQSIIGNDAVGDGSGVARLDLLRYAVHGDLPAGLPRWCDSTGLRVRR